MSDDFMARRFKAFASVQHTNAAFLSLIAFTTLALMVQNLAAQSGDAKSIEIVRAVFGTGRGAAVCTKQIAKIIQNRDKLTKINTPGLGLKNRRGKSRDALRITYRFDGKPVYNADGKRAVLVLKRGENVNIYKAILNHAKKLEGNRPKSSPDKTAADVEKPTAETTGKSKENSASATEKFDPNRIERPEFFDKPKRFKKSLATLQALMVQQHEDGRQFGITVDVIAQATEHRGGAVDFQRRRSIGKEMVISMEEAERAVRARYPKWDKRIIRLSFGDKYSNKSGGSAGAAFALLILSLLEVFEIDSDFALTGDILTNWKIVGVGGVPIKVRSAVIDQKQIVAIPSANIENVGDVMVKFSTDYLWKVQVFSAPDLQSLIALARTDRADKLNQAISAFAEIQNQLQSRGEQALTDPSTKRQLERVVTLAPNHQSAKFLLLVCNGKSPARLTRAESLRELSIAMKPVDNVLWNSPTMDQATVSVTRLKTILDQTETLQEICHEDIAPVVKQFDRYVKALKRLLERPQKRRLDAFNKERLELVEQCHNISVNREFIESLIRQH